MKTLNMLARLLAVTLLLLLCFGCESKTKEQMLQEGLALKEQKNFTGATVLFRNALEKDPNFFEARHQLGLIYLEGAQYGRAEKELEKVLLQDPANTTVLLDLADVLLRSGQTDKAVPMLEAHLRNQTGSARALELFGKGLALQGKTQQAEEVFQKALALDDSHRGARNGLARLYASSKRRSEARTLLSDSIARDPKNQEAHALLMQLEGAAGNLDEAIAAGRRLLEEFPGDIQTTYLLGILELNRGNIDAASELAADISNRHPTHPAGMRLQGLTLYAQQQFTPAVDKLQQSLRQMPDLSGRYFLGLSHFKLAQYELALNQFQAILDSQPDHGQARLMVAQTLFRQQRLDDSRMAAEILLAAEPDNALARDILGSVFLAQGDFDRGMSEIDRAIELAPDLVEAQLKKGMVHLSQGDLDQADIPLEEAVRLAPDLLNSRLLLAASHLQRQNFSKAVSVLEEGLTGQIGDAVLYNYLAAAYSGQGKTKEALAQLEKAKQRKADYLTPYINLANHYLSQGMPKRAAAEYQAFLKVEPDNVRALVSLATLQELQGDLPGAEQSLMRAADTGSVDGFVAAALFLGRQGKLEKALEVSQNGLKAHPDTPSLLELEGKVLLRQGQKAGAIRSFQRFAEVQPLQGLPMLIATLVQTNQPDEAEKVARQQMDKSPTDPQGYLLLADIYKHRRLYAKGLEVLDQGLIKIPHNPLLQMARASLFLAQDNTDQALTIYNEIRRRQPDYLPATFSLATLYDRLGDKKQALALYRQCLAQDANYLPALNNLAYLYADNYGDLDEALKMARLALRQRPADAGIMDTLGYVLVRQKRFAEALPFLQKAAQMLPDEPLVQLHLGEAYFGLGKRAEAKAALDKALAGPIDQTHKLRVRNLLNELAQQS